MSISKTIQKKIESDGERVWRFADFRDMPPMAVAQTLSRLARRGVVERLGKGLYYRARETSFGKSKPNMGLLRSFPIQGKEVFPAGISAANLLGFSTQNPAQIEVATNGSSLPRLLFGKNTIIHTRRPESWKELSQEDGAVLDFLRQRGNLSELSSEETVNRLLQYFRDQNLFERLFHVAMSEPPRVRAIFGAIGQEIGYPESFLYDLRKSLNPLSKFDFGKLLALKYARQWQAKELKNT